MLRNSLLLSILILAPVVTTGCIAEPTEDVQRDQTAHENRGPIGKADLYGQCMEIDIKYCGGQSSGNCWCDDLCTTFGDCCSDYEPVCDAGPSCDPELMCGQAITCVDGQYYPTTCGPANCDEPMGPCEPEPEYCGGFAGLTCGEGTYCHYEIGDYCGYADAMGTCQTAPDACAEIYSPVCGCDGQNYSNECEANTAGISVKQTGDCECQPGYTMQYCWGGPQCTPIGAQC